MQVRSAFVDAIHRVLLGSLLLSGCAYQSDSFSYSREPFSGVYVSVSCLDLALDHRKQPNASDVISYAFGNRATSLRSSIWPLRVSTDTPRTVPP